MILNLSLIYFGAYQFKKINKIILCSSKNQTGSLVLNSDAGETTSTDSDIGTSPSGITFASPPSSPQQNQQSSIKNYSNFDQKNISNPSTKTNTSSLNYSSIIRQNSYLNAVQLNDFKINKLKQSSKIYLSYCFFHHLSYKNILIKLGD